MSVTRFGAICAATLGLACAGTAPAPASAAPSPPAGVSALDGRLLTAAHQGDLWEIATGQDARTGATSSCVKQVGTDFIRDHRTLDAGVAKTASRLGVALPSGQTAAQLKQAAGLKSEAGTRSYDKAWLTAQYTAHVQTLALIDKELASGTNPRVKSLAQSARPVVVRHAQMVRGGVCRAPSSAARMKAGQAGRLAAAAYGPQGATSAVAFGGVLLGGSGAAWVARRRRSTGAPVPPR